MGKANNRQSWLLMGDPVGYRIFQT